MSFRNILVVTVAPYLLVQSLNVGLDAYTFEQYKVDFGRSYEIGTDEHATRKMLFEEARAKVLEHNAKNLSWRLGVNHLSDLSKAEMKARMGYKPQPRAARSSLLEVNRTEECVQASSSCVDQNSRCCDGTVCGVSGSCEQVATDLSQVDWSEVLPTARPVLEQGQCGSCWAVAAAAVLQFHADIASNMRFRKQISPQTLLSCTANALSCGGNGGCQGATAELAFKYVASQGQAGGAATLDSMPYTPEAHAGDCQRSESSFLQKHKKQHSQMMLSIKSYRTLEMNNADQMIQTLVTVGPLVASIVGEGLQGYESGVIKGCDSFVIDHAVVMMGIGHDAESDQHYWKLRNSWGPVWGEEGYFRLQRFSPHGAEPCGTDTDPSKGIACKDKPGGAYPKEQYFCGACGILSDTAYPVGTAVPDALLEAQEKEQSAGPLVKQTTLQSEKASGASEKASAASEKASAANAFAVFGF